MSSDTACRTASDAVMIAARGLGKCYRIYKRPEDRLKQMLWLGRRDFHTDYWALRGVDLEIRRGETVAIVGRNGAGKSTLLQAICGTLEPTTGSLDVNGRVAALLELGAGFNPEFTGAENVRLSAAILGLDGAAIEARFPAIAAFAGIGDFMDQPVKLYSSGMYARLAFAVAAHVDADILIVDEILAVGDAAFTQKCMRFIERFKRTGTLLFVSHDISTVTALCDRALWLDRGTTRMTGPAKEVAHAYIASLYGEADDSAGFRIGGTRKTMQDAALKVVDKRQGDLAGSSARNAIDLFDFDPEGPWFGQRGASITAVRLLDAAGRPLPSLLGGEEVVMEVTATAGSALHRPIIGFFVKDPKGQFLFGDNTFLTYRQGPPVAGPGQQVVARFHFQMPYLPTGDYAICAAIADGTQTDHVQHHWLDDALFFRVTSSHVAKGLVGIPMIDISLDVQDAAEAAA